MFAQVFVIVVFFTPIGVLILDDPNMNRLNRFNIWSVINIDLSVNYQLYVDLFDLEYHQLESLRFC